jgi:hypothetical protein
MPVDATYYLVALKASRTNGFLVGCLPRKKLGTQQVGKKVIQLGSGSSSLAQTPSSVSLDPAFERRSLSSSGSTSER